MALWQAGSRVFGLFLRRGGGGPTPTRTQSRKFSPMAWYNSRLEKSPVITKSITSGGKGLLDIVFEHELSLSLSLPLSPSQFSLD